MKKMDYYNYDCVINSQLTSAELNLLAHSSKIIYDSKSINYNILEQNAIFNEIAKSKINNYKNPISSIESLKGFVFEFFVVKSYNIDSINNNSPIRAFLTEPNHPKSDIILRNIVNDDIVARIQTKSGKTSLKCLSSPKAYLKYLSNEHLIVTSESYEQYNKSKYSNTFLKKIGDRLNTALKCGGNCSKSISNNELKHLTKSLIQNDIRVESSAKLAYLSDYYKRKSRYLFKIFKTASKGFFYFSVVVSAHDNYLECYEGKQSMYKSGVNFFCDISGVNTLFSICNFLYNNHAGIPFFDVSEIYHSEPLSINNLQNSSEDNYLETDVQIAINNKNIEKYDENGQKYYENGSYSIFTNSIKTQGIELLHDIICLFIQKKVGKKLFENAPSFKKALGNVLKKNFEQICKKISSFCVVQYFQLYSPGFDTSIETAIDFGLLFVKGGTKQELCLLLTKGMGATFTNSLFNVPVFISSSLSCYVNNSNLLLLKSELDVNIPIYYIITASFSFSSLQLNKRQVLNGIFLNTNAFGKNGVGLGVCLGSLEENKVIINKSLHSMNVIHKQFKIPTFYLYCHFGILSKHLFCKFGVNYKKNVNTCYLKNSKKKVLPIENIYSHKQNIKDLNNRPLLEKLVIMHARDLIGIQEKQKGMGYEQAVCKKQIEESKVQGISSCGRRSNIDANYVFLTGIVNKPKETLNREKNQELIGTFEHENYYYSKKIRLQGGRQSSSCRVAFFKFNKRNKILGFKEYQPEIKNYSNKRFDILNKGNRFIIYQIKIQNYKKKVDILNQPVHKKQQNRKIKLFEYQYLNNLSKPHRIIKSDNPDKTILVTHFNNDKITKRVAYATDYQYPIQTSVEKDIKILKKYNANVIKFHIFELTNLQTKKGIFYKESLPSKSFLPGTSISAEKISYSNGIFVKQKNKEVSLKNEKSVHSYITNYFSDNFNFTKKQVLLQVDDNNIEVFKRELYDLDSIGFVTLYTITQLICDVVSNYNIDSKLLKYGFFKLLSNIGCQYVENYVMKCLQNGDSKSLVAIFLFGLRFIGNETDNYYYKNILNSEICDKTDLPDVLNKKNHSFFTIPNILAMKNISLLLYFQDENPYANVLDLEREFEFSTFTALYYLITYLYHKVTIFLNAKNKVDSEHEKYCTFDYFTCPYPNDCPFKNCSLDNLKKEFIINLGSFLCNKVLSDIIASYSNFIDETNSAKFKTLILSSLKCIGFTCVKDICRKKTYEYFSENGSSILNIKTNLQRIQEKYKNLIDKSLRENKCKYFVQSQSPNENMYFIVRFISYFKLEINRLINAGSYVIEDFLFKKLNFKEVVKVFQTLENIYEYMKLRCINCLNYYDIPISFSVIDIIQHINGFFEIMTQLFRHIYKLEHLIKDIYDFLKLYFSKIDLSDSTIKTFNTLVYYLETNEIDYFKIVFINWSKNHNT